MSLPLTNSAAPATSATQPDLSALRVALFSGNYNYVRDGANQALNRLVGHLLRQGAAVRVYSPVVAEPAFAPTGDLVGIQAQCGTCIVTRCGGPPRGVVGTRTAPAGAGQRTHAV